MIITLTPNPSVDRTVFVDQIAIGAVNRSQRSWSEPSGKGVNVALALHAHGAEVRAIVTAGGSVGAQLRQMLTDAELDAVIVPISGNVRSNISLTQPDGTVTKINEAGPSLTADERDQLTAEVARQLSGRATWLVCAGSLPSGLPDAWYGEMITLGHRHRVPVAVDTSGSPLARSLTAEPDLVKPNLHELAELTGISPRTLGEAIDAAHQVRHRGARTVLASLGSDGAILVDAEGALWGHAPVTNVVSTVGAGDAMLAGYLSCRNGRTQALATALQWGAAAVQHEGTLFSPNQPHVPVTVTVTESIDLDRRLDDAHDPAIHPASTAASPN